VALAEDLALAGDEAGADGDPALSKAFLGFGEGGEEAGVGIGHLLRYGWEEGKKTRKRELDGKRTDVGGSEVIREELGQQKSRKGRIERSGSGLRQYWGLVNWLLLFLDNNIHVSFSITIVLTL
jgi:hypothetical protein